MNSNAIPGALVAIIAAEQRTAAHEGMDEMLRERVGGSGPEVLTIPVYIGIGSRNRDTMTQAAREGAVAFSTAALGIRKVTVHNHPMDLIASGGAPRLKPDWRKERGPNDVLQLS